MFTDEDFQVFEDETLEGRMAGIRQKIDPKFDEMAQAFIAELSQKKTVYSHIAKHQRRYKNPPMNTWIAFSTNSRGYKMVPHVMLGFWDDRLFIWLASLAENRDRQEAILRLNRMLPKMNELGKEFDISPNHMAKKSETASKEGLNEQLEHYQKIKQADFLLGRQWMRHDPIFEDKDLQHKELMATVTALSPFFEQLSV